MLELCAIPHALASAGGSRYAAVPARRSHILKVPPRIAADPTRVGRRNGDRAKPLDLARIAQRRPMGIEIEEAFASARR